MVASCINTHAIEDDQPWGEITRTRAKWKAGYFFVAHSVCVCVCVCVCVHRFWRNLVLEMFGVFFFWTLYHESLICEVICIV